MTHKRKLSLIGLLTAFGALYTYAWFYAADKIEQGLLLEIEVLRGQSYEIDHGPIHVKGYPLHIDIEIDGLYVEAPGQNTLSLSTEGALHATGSLFNPSKVTVKSEEPVVIAQGSQGTEVQSGITLVNANQVQIIFDLSHHHQAPETVPLSTHVVDVLLTEFHMPLLRIGADNMHLQFSRQPSDIQLMACMIDARSVKAPMTATTPSLPSSIQRFHGAFAIKGDRLYDLPLDQFMLKWYETDGMIDMTNMTIEWGDIKIAGSGSLALDENLQPVASFATEISGLHQTLGVLKSQGLISEGVQNIILLTLSPFQEKRRHADHVKPELYHKISMSVQSNGESNDFIIGTIPVFKFPFIDWQGLSGFDIDSYAKDS